MSKKVNKKEIDKIYNQGRTIYSEPLRDLDLCELKKYNFEGKEKFAVYTRIDYKTKFML